MGHSSVADNSVRLLIDAEQTYYQPAIDYLALAMSKKYNKKEAIIHNTYQMYLKDGIIDNCACMCVE
jgi:proline dehydrogenase